MVALVTSTIDFLKAYEFYAYAAFGSERGSNAYRFYLTNIDCIAEQKLSHEKGCSIECADMEVIFYGTVNVVALNNIQVYYKDLNDNSSMRSINYCTFIKDSKDIFYGRGEKKIPFGEIHIRVFFDSAILNVINKKENQRTIYNHAENTNKFIQEIDDVYRELLLKDSKAESFRDFSEKELAKYIKLHIKSDFSDKKVNHLFRDIRRDDAKLVNDDD